MYIGKNDKERAEFIETTASGVYDGTTEHDEFCLLQVEKGDYMIVKIQRKEKPEWFECIEYDKHGCQVGVFYEPFRKE